MPLLRKEAEIFPDDLFDRAIVEPWRVAHVRSRHEKTLGRELLDRRIPYYMPQIEQTKRRTGRTFRSFLPLFSGYVFFRGDAAARDVVRRRPAVINVLDVTDQDLLASELAQIRRLQLAGALLVEIDAVGRDETGTSGNQQHGGARRAARGREHAVRLRCRHRVGG